MSFINKSANYSQTFLLKSQLATVLKLYNEHVGKLYRRDSVRFSTDTIQYLVPNNNIKYYLYVTHKNKLENCKENYNILYFFPDASTLEHFENNKTLAFSLSDFFLEINHHFKHTLLFEGYLYQNNNKMHFLITDILAKDDNIITCDFALRHALVNEIYLESYNGTLVNLNNHMSFGIHPVLSSDSENLIQVFKHNFVFKDQIYCLEKIYSEEFKKERLVTNTNINPIKDLMFEKGKYTDVYNAIDPVNGNNLGILYVKGIKDSLLLKNHIQDSNKHKIIKCKYNSTFNKWEPIIVDNHLVCC